MVILTETVRVQEFLFHFIDLLSHMVLLSFPKDYFVLWDETMLNVLLAGKDKVTKKSKRLLHQLKLDGSSHANKKTKFSDHPDTNWLSKAQRIML